MRILVTGGEGLLGTALQKAVAGLTDEYIFTGYDDFDITDKEAVDLMIKVNAFDVVVNCAAITDYDKAEKHPEIAYKFNVTGVENLAVALAREGGVLIQPGCMATYLPSDSVIYETKQQALYAVERGGCDAVIITPILKTADEWPAEIGRAARLIVEIIEDIKNHGKPDGINFFVLKPGESDD